MKTLAQLLSLACRLVVAGLFIYASHDKVWDPAPFAESMARYEMLPLWAVNPASVLMAWLELWVGVLLLVGWWLRPAALWASGLLALFTGLMVYAGLMGVGYDCGCFPGQEGHPAGYEAALRDLAFLAPALWLCIFPGNWLRLDRLFAWLLRAPALRSQSTMRK